LETPRPNKGEVEMILTLVAYLWSRGTEKVEKVNGVTAFLALLSVLIALAQDMAIIGWLNK